MISPTKLLALLVHRGDLAPEVAHGALSSGDPGSYLAQRGVCTEAEWQQWLQTEGGTRPQLTRYELGALIGEGGVGRVFEATDKTDGRKVALKVLKPELASDPVQTERFVREARLLMSLEHAHVVKGLRVAKEGGTIFFAMEQLPGRCLQDVIADGELGRLDEEAALKVVVDIAGALAALHDQGLVHRDVKPGNVIWSEERGGVLIDLGFALQGDGEGGGDTTAGTVHYIAPEQARGEGGLDVRADIYALGATLYHLTTGSLPFEGKTSEEVLAKQVLESLSGDRIRALGLSVQLRYFLEKMMAKDVEMRFQSPQQLVDEVGVFLEQRRHERAMEQRQSARPRLGQQRRDGSRLRRRRR
ncbi:MAG: serine/threonine-protein kinase [Planctomycetota bacterium]|nr:serine/threonine-protein kinase [Planctomycetota bacterium]